MINIQPSLWGWYLEDGKFESKASKVTTTLQLKWINFRYTKLQGHQKVLDHEMFWFKTSQHLRSIKHVKKLNYPMSSPGSNGSNDRCQRAREQKLRYCEQNSGDKRGAGGMAWNGLNERSELWNIVCIRDAATCSLCGLIKMFGGWRASHCTSGSRLLINLSTVSFESLKAF